MNKFVFVVCYDIESDTRRRVVARVLEGVGLRVQESVFEVRSENVDIHQLSERLQRRLRPGDSLRIYPVPRSQLEHSITIGGPPIAEANDFILL